LIVICENLAAEFPEAEQIIRKAIAACPDQITLSGTLGGILVEQGRHEEAAPLLKALNYVSPEPHEQAITAAYLAHTSLRSGDPEAARSYADKAMSVCPGHRLVKRLVRSL
jgi:predicted Zn-dependent protease